MYQTNIESVLLCRGGQTIGFVLRGVLLNEVEFQWREPITREEQVLSVDGIKNWVAFEIDFQGPTTVTVVGKSVIAWLDVFTCPCGAPPTRGDTYLWIFGLHV